MILKYHVNKDQKILFLLKSCSTFLCAKFRIKRSNGLLTKEKLPKRNSSVVADVSICNKIYFRVTAGSQCPLAWLALCFYSRCCFSPDLINVSDAATCLITMATTVAVSHATVNIERPRGGVFDRFSSTFRFPFYFSRGFKLQNGNAPASRGNFYLLSIRKIFAYESSPKNNGEFSRHRILSLDDHLYRACERHAKSNSTQSIL